MIKITALIITLNEEKHIGACIDSLTGVADEVLVIDSLSTDKTKEIAGSKGARVIESAFKGFGPQRNFGALYASHDLILVLDADEQISQELKESIVTVKNAGTMAAAYCFNWLNFVGDRAVKTCGWYPDRHCRMYDKNKAKWNDRKVHEGLMVNGETVFLEGDVMHHTYDSLPHLKEKTTAYARLGASLHKGKNPLILTVKMIFNPAIKFIKTYIFQLGFTDGYLGFMISYYRARETFFKYYWAL